MRTTAELRNSKEEMAVIAFRALITMAMTVGMIPKAVQRLNWITMEIVMTSEAQMTTSNTMRITKATMATMNMLTTLIIVVVLVVAMVA